VVEYTIDLEDSYPANVVVKFNKDFLVSTGIYSDKETRNDAVVFHIILNNENGSVHNLVKQEFNQELKDAYRSEKQIKKDKQEDW
jgi:hypothetical protein